MRHSRCLQTIADRLRRSSYLYHGSADLRTPNNEEKQPRLPFGALIHPSSGRALIPEEWPMLIPYQCFALKLREEAPH